MRLTFRRNDDLPPLAWHCRIDAPGGTADILHGAGVEVRENAFFEGAWNGEFRRMDFLEHERFGTGGAIVDGALRFAAPDHILSGLFEHSGATGHLSISNSLPLMLAREDLSFEDGAANAQGHLGAIAEGLSRSPLDIPLGGGASLKMHFWCDLDVTADLRTAPRRRRVQADFSDFASYTGYIRGVMAGVFANAADARRIRSYRPLATLSSGYDSTAIATLAAEEGCRDVVSFSHSRTSRGGTDEDDGREVARILGLDLTIADRLAYTAWTDMPELESWGQGSEFLSIRPLIEGRVVLVGHFGDAMWERDLSDTGEDVGWTQVSGHNLTDLRLSRDFILFPVAFLAAWRKAEVNRISRSDEMRDWTLDNDYDRPICRRIAEEKGIPRAAFGQKKLAAGVFSRIEGMEATTSPASLRDYREWKAAHIPPAAARGGRLRHALGDWNTRIGRKVYKFTAVRFGRGLVLPTLFPPVPAVTEGSFAFVWAMRRLSGRMARAARTE
jgi:hypothetical protein